MRHPVVRVLKVLLLVAGLTALHCAGEAGAAGREGQQRDSSHTVRLKTKARVGTYLTDARGMTLYQLKRDAPGRSACTGDCVVRWPVFYTRKIVVSGKLDKKDFAVITRDDGIMQTTYRGRPLYYSARDSAAGDMNGEGVSPQWQAVYTRKIRR